MPTIYVACLREQVAEWVLIRQNIAERWHAFLPQHLIISDPQTHTRSERAALINGCDLFILHYTPLGFVHQGLQADLAEARASKRMIFVACAEKTDLPPELASYPRVSAALDGADLEHGLRVIWRQINPRSERSSAPPRRITLLGLFAAATALICLVIALLTELISSSAEALSANTQSNLMATHSPSLLTTLPLEIRGASGEMLGMGTASLYAPRQIYDDGTAYVRLTLDPSSEAISLTPAVPDDEMTSPELAIYPIMAAELICADGSFSGCDNEGQLRRSVSSTGDHVWSWILTPLIADGRRDLEVRLYRYLMVNGEEVPERIWSSPFAIRVRLIVSRSGAAVDNSPILLVVFTVALAALVGLGYLMARAIRTSLRRRESARPSIFLSYRHDTSTADTWILSKGLVQRGIDVWVDFERIFKGHFRTEIEQAIHACDLFVAVLAPISLDSEWVRREITTAVQQNKPITCVLHPGVHLDSLLENQPEAIRQLRDIHHLTLTPPDYDVTIERLARAVRSA